MSKSSNASSRDENTASFIRGVNITVKPLDKRSVKITWDKVPDLNPNEPIRRYTICYQLHPGVTKSAKFKKIVDGSALSTKIFGLKQATKYYASAYASTDSHDGPLGNEVEFMTLASFPGFDNGDIYRFWSLQSKFGDGYICMTNSSSGTDGYVVNASGKVEETDTLPTKLTFVQQGGPLESYILNFQKDQTPYSLNASRTVVKATKYSNGASNGATIFQVIQLEEPQDNYFVLKKSDEDLYLSSDGAGVMKLKELNDVPNPPPGASVVIDPALLFRVVKPANVVEPTEG